VQEARSNYFPALTLTGAFGSESAALAELFTSPAAIWRIGLGLVQPLLTLKYIESAVELAEARRLQTTVEYQQTVQIAFREVHDALVANGYARESLAAHRAAR
jgi:multidrug efflux system outer membrane protein